MSMKSTISCLLKTFLWLTAFIFAFGYVKAAMALGVVGFFIFTIVLLIAGFTKRG